MTLEDRRVPDGYTMGADSRSERVEEGEVELDDAEHVESTLQAEVGLPGRFQGRHSPKRVQVEATAEVES